MNRWLFAWMVMLVGCLNENPTRFDHTTPEVHTDAQPSTPVQNRHIWQQPNLILAKLGELKGKSIVDIGAGTGYFSFRFLKQGATVIALDIDDQMLEVMTRESQYLPPELQERLLIRKPDPAHAGLDGKNVDYVFVSNTYTYIDDRVSYFEELKPSLTDGGKLVIIDFKKKNTPIGPPMEERMALGTVENELIKAGYDILESDDISLQFQYIIVARPNQE